MFELEERKLQADLEKMHIERQRDMELQHEYERINNESKRLEEQSAGMGSGGYIIIDMPDQDRPFFHDLLKGFEDYAKLKGYSIAFSIDATYGGKIAFKFTGKNDGVVVGPERVRRDFKEYVENVSNGNTDDLDQMPIIINIDEHNYFAAQLKLRINYLQHSNQAYKTTIKYYEGLLDNLKTFPALAAPNVYVQTAAGNMEMRHLMDSRSYSNVNSPKAIAGTDNTLTDNSINLGQSFNEKHERITALDQLISKLETAEGKTAETEKAERALVKVKSELTDEAEPNTSAIKKWMETAKNSLATAALSYEIVEAGRRVWELFGL
jgi:hypothetical protein